jgi:hypothetical protein
MFGVCLFVKSAQRREKNAETGMDRFGHVMAEPEVAFQARGKPRIKLPTRRIIMKLINLFGSFFLVILLASFLGCASTSTQEGTGEYIDDSVITTKVKAAIFQEDSLKSSEINVETFKGVVQLSGFVNSQADINKAVGVARTVKGVTSVKNSMLVKQPKKKAVEGC